MLDKLNEFNFEELTEFDKQRLQIIIQESNLYDSLNRREIVGISKEEFDFNVKYFREIAEKAMEILEKIK